MDSIDNQLDMKAQCGNGVGQTGNLMLMMLGFAGVDVFGGGGGDMFGSNTKTSTPTCEDAGGPEGSESGVTNNSSQPIMVKPENRDEYIILQPGESYIGLVDGFTFPFAEGLEVYKVGDPFNFYGFYVYDDDIDIDRKIDSYGLLKEFNDVRWGEVSPTWIINDLRSRGWNSEQTLGGWRPLFEFNYNNYHNF